MQVPAAPTFLLKQVSECSSFLYAGLVSPGQQGQQQTLVRGRWEGRSSTADSPLSALSAPSKRINQNLHQKGPWAAAG